MRPRRRHPHPCCACSCTLSHLRLRQQQPSRRPSRRRRLQRSRRQWRPPPRTPAQVQGGGACLVGRCCCVPARSCGHAHMHAQNKEIPWKCLCCSILWRSLGSCVDVLSHAACRPAVQRGSCGLEGRHALWPSHLPHCPVPPSHCTGASIDPSSVSAEEAAETEAGAREKRMRSITSALLDLATGRCAVCCEGVCEGGGTGCGGRGLCAHCWLQWGWF